VVPVNQLKSRLRQGHSLIGTMVAEFRQPSVMQILANGGFHFVIIDNEHGPFGIETLADMCRSAVFLGITPIVRVPDFVYSHIAPALDAGAQGIMVPRITKPSQVKEIVQIMKFPPKGQRGNALSRGYCNFQGGNVMDVMKTVNDETMLIVQIETAEALERLPEIVAIDGVDCALVGPNDLSIALGVGGQMTSPVLQSAIQRVIDVCQKKSKWPGLHMNDAQLVAEWGKRGMRVVSCGSEILHLMSAAKNITKTIGQALPSPQAL